MIADLESNSSKSSEMIKKIQEESL